MAAPIPALNADGQTISLQFSEDLDQQSIANALDNFKLFIDGQQTAGNFSLVDDSTSTDPNNPAGPTDPANTTDPTNTADPNNNTGDPLATGNSSNNSFTLRFNGSNIEAGQELLLSYANNDTAITNSGITDLAGNALESFVFQLQNYSALDSTFAPEGFTEPTDGEFIRINFAEPVTHFSNYDPDQGSVSPTATFDANRIKDAISINVDGYDLNPNDYSIIAESTGIRINLDNQYSKIYKDQIVTVSYDASLIPEADTLIDFSGNFSESGSQLVENNSTLIAPDLIPPSLDSASSSSDGQTISLTFSEQLNGIPAKEAFQLSYNGLHVGPEAIELIEVAPAPSGSDNNDISYANYSSTDFSIRLDATNGIDSASFFPASVMSAFALWVDGIDQTALIRSVELDPPAAATADPGAGAATGLRISLTETAAFAANSDVEVRFYAPVANQLRNNQSELITTFTQSVHIDGIEPAGHDTHADHHSPDSYTLNIRLNPEYALGSNETLVISYGEGNNITDASGSNPLISFEQVVSNNSNVQGRDITPPTPSNGDTSNNGSSISLEFNEPLDRSNLQNLQNSNAFSIYVNGVKLDSADFRLIGSPEPHISDPHLLDLSFDSNDLSIKITPIEFNSADFDFQQALDNNSFRIKLDGIEQTDLIQSIVPFPSQSGEGLQLKLSANAALAAAGSITVTFDGFDDPNGNRFEGFSDTIDLNPNTNNNDPANQANAQFGSLIFSLSDHVAVKSGQSVFVSYDGSAELRDAAQNNIQSFTQIVNNSSALTQDNTPPTLLAAPIPALNADGQTISLQFSEDLDQQSIANALDNFKLFIDGQQTAGNFSLVDDSTSTDPNNPAGPTDPANTTDPTNTADPNNNTGDPLATGNSSNNSFTLRFNGSNIEAGQELLLSYANNDTAITNSGITDLAGNALESFVFQLQNYSALDSTDPEITDGFVTDDGTAINVNVSEVIGLDNPAASTTDPATGTSNTPDPATNSTTPPAATGADGHDPAADPNFVIPPTGTDPLTDPESFLTPDDSLDPMLPSDGVVVTDPNLPTQTATDPTAPAIDWNSQAIKDAFTININGRVLDTNDFNLSFDSAQQDIVFNLQNSELIFEGQSVTLDFDSTKLSDPSIPQITDSSGNPLQTNTIVIDNDSNVPNPNPTLEELQNDLETTQGCLRTRNRRN